MENIELGRHNSTVITPNLSPDALEGEFKMQLSQLVQILTAYFNTCGLVNTENLLELAVSSIENPFESYTDRFTPVKEMSSASAQLPSDINRGRYYKEINQENYKLYSSYYKILLQKLTPEFESFSEIDETLRGYQNLSRLVKYSIYGEPLDIDNDLEDIKTLIIYSELIAGGKKINTHLKDRRVTSEDVSEEYKQKVQIDYQTYANLIEDISYTLGFFPDSIEAKALIDAIIEIKKLKPEDEINIQKLVASLDSEEILYLPETLTRIFGTDFGIGSETGDSLYENLNGHKKPRRPSVEIKTTGDVTTVALHSAGPTIPKKGNDDNKGNENENKGGTKNKPKTKYAENEGWQSVESINIKPDYLDIKSPFWKDVTNLNKNYYYLGYSNFNESLHRPPITISNIATQIKPILSNLRSILDSRPEIQIPEGSFFNALITPPTENQETINLNSILREYLRSSDDTLNKQSLADLRIFAGQLVKPFREKVEQLTVDPINQLINPLHESITQNQILTHTQKELLIIPIEDLKSLYYQLETLTKLNNLSNFTIPVSLINQIRGLSDLVLQTLNSSEFLEYKQPALRLFDRGVYRVMLYPDIPIPVRNRLSTSIEKKFSTQTNNITYPELKSYLNSIFGRILSTYHTIVKPD